MADEEKSKPLDISELQSLVIRAWNRAGVSSRCELCSHSKWTIIHTESLDGVAIPLRAARMVSVPGKLYMAYALECENCGNVRIFSKDTLERLAGEEEAQKADDSKEAASDDAS